MHHGGRGGFVYEVEGDIEALATARAVILRVETCGPVDDAAARRAVGADASMLVVRGEGQPDPDRHREQRSNREVARWLDGARNRGGSRPVLHVFLRCSPQAAMDLGLRLVSSQVVLYREVADGWHAEEAPPPPAPIVSADEARVARVDAPTDPVVAARWGRSLATLGARSIVVLRDGEACLELVGAAVKGRRGEADAARAQARAVLGSDANVAALDALERLTTLGFEDAATSMERAELLHALGRDIEAAAEALRVVAAHPDQVGLTVGAARLLSTIGRPIEAESLAAAAVRLDPEHAIARELHSATSARLGRLHQSRTELLAAISLRPTAAWWARLAASHLPALDFERVARFASVGLAMDPTDPALLDLRAEAASRLGAPDAHLWIRAAAAASPDLWEAAAVRWLLVGHVELARQVVDGAPGPRGVAARATWALWAMDLDTAERLASDVARALPEDPHAELVLGAVATLRGRPDHAIPHLDRALAGIRRGRGSPLVDASTAHAWQAEARLLQGDARAALREAREAMTAARSYSVLAHAMRVFAVLAAAPGDDDRVDPYAWTTVATKLVSLAEAPGLPDGRKKPLLSWLRAIVDRFGGNRSATPTLVDAHGRLMVFHTPRHPRHEGRRAQLMLRTRTPTEVLEAFRALQAEHDGDELTRTYCGETLLWLGRYDDAEVEFRAALARAEQTVWAWIGLGASQLLRGQLDDAFATWARGVAAVGFEGPTLFVYRGEAKWRRGDLDGAAKDLDVALADKPHRLSAWVLRARVAWDQGQTAPAERVVDAVRAHAPGLWLDAAAIAPESPRAMLDAMLLLFRGNRSASLVTWFGADESPRFASWGRFLRPDELFPRPRG